MRRSFVCLSLLLLAAACGQEPRVPTSAPTSGEPEWSMPSFDIAGGGSSTGVNAQSGASTLTIPAPAGVVAGDFLVAQVSFEKGSEIDFTQPETVPTDWVLIRRDHFSSDIGQAIFTKVATAAEPPGYTWGFKKSDNSVLQVRAAGGITRFTGVNTLHPDGPILGSSGASGDGIVLTAPSVNALTDAMLLAFFAHKKLTTLTNPSGMTDLYHVQHSNQSGPTARASQEIRAVDGATGDRVSNASAVVGADKWVAQLLALRSNTIPVYTAPADQESDEGEDHAFDLGSFVDPDGHPSWEITVDWGDGSSETFTYNNPFPADPFAARALGTRNHIYVDNGSYTVTVTVDDGTDTDSDTFEVTVNNLPPEVTAGDDQNSDEGEDKAFDLGSFSDAGVDDDPWAVNVDWGDGSADDDFNTNTQGALGTRNHTYADNGVYTVTVTVTDKDGGSDFDTFDVTVANVAPSVTAPADQASDEGVSASFDLGSFSDPGVNDDPWAVNVDWGDGSADDDFNTNTQGALGSLNHTYATMGTYTVTVTVTDKDGDSGFATFDVVVANLPPEVTAPDDQESDEGENHAFDIGSFTDTGVNDDPWTVNVDWGDGSTDDNFNTNSQGALGNRNHTYADNGLYTVTVTVTDVDGDPGVATFDVTVDNLPPDYTAPANQTATVNIAKSFNIGSFSDPGIDDDPWAVNVDWGDGSADDNFNVNSQGSLGTRSHTFTSAATRTVTVTVTDKDGGSDFATFDVVVTAPSLGTLYLHNNPIRTNTACGHTNQQANLPMNSSAPVATILCNYDQDRDAFAGRLIQKGATGATETDLTKFQTWRSAAAPAGGMTFSGNVDLIIFAGMKDFTGGGNLTIRGFVRAFLRDCPAAGACTLISSTSLDDSNWHEGVNAWIQKTLTFASVPSTTIAVGRFLELKVIVDSNSANDMWFAYDTTTQNSRLVDP